MKSTMRLTLLMILACFVTGCAMMNSGPSDPIIVDNEKALEGLDKVAIGSFKITFVTFDKSSAKSESSMFSNEPGYAKSVMRAKLTGVQDDIMQSITDAAYQDLQDKLKNKGIEIVDRAEITSQKAWSKIDMEESPYKDTFNKAMKMVTGGSREDATFAPSGMSLPKIPFQDVKAAASPYQFSEITKETGIPVLDVHYTVHFIRFSSETSYNPNNWVDFKGPEYSAKVLAGQGVHVVSGNASRMAVIKGMNGTFSKPNASLRAYWTFLEPGPYGTSVDATSGAQKAANVFSSLMGAFSGSSSSAKEIEIQAKPALYKERAIGALNMTNDAFIKAMTTGN